MGKEETNPKEMAKVWNAAGKSPNAEREFFSCRIQIASIPGLEERLRYIFARNALGEDYQIIEYEPTTSGHSDVTISVNRQTANIIRAKGYIVRDAINKVRMKSIKAPGKPQAKL